MMDGYYGFGSAWMMLMPLLWFLLLGAVVWAAIRLTQSPGRGSVSRETEGRETPTQILDRRFASGEIDAAAYDDARARLSGRGSRSA